MFLVQVRLPKFLKSILFIGFEIKLFPFLGTGGAEVNFFTSQLEDNPLPTLSPYLLAYTRLIDGKSYISSLTTQLTKQLLAIRSFLTLIYQQTCSGQELLSELIDSSIAKQQPCNWKLFSELIDSLIDQQT